MNEIFLTISRSLIFPFLDCQVTPPTPIEFFIIFPQEVFKTDKRWNPAHSILKNIFPSVVHEAVGLPCAS